MAEGIFDRLHAFEDSFTERKSQGAANRGELRKTLVAFANSVPEGRTAILFIGVGDKGQFDGITEPDSLQRTVSQVGEQECYPPVRPEMQVITIDGKQILAITGAISPGPRTSAPGPKALPPHQLCSRS